VPHILITNDDGYQSPALQALARAMVAVGRVTVFAPDHNWSAAGHTKTMHKPLRVSQSVMADGTPLYITTGTPSDCVGLALLGIVPERPDIVISGINNGSNLGQDVTYSGTVAGAMEAAVMGLPAIAASQEFAEGDVVDAPSDATAAGDGASLAARTAFAARLVADLAREVLARGLPPGVFLNVNFPGIPPDQVQGIQVTRLGRRVYRDVLIKRLDPKRRPYYWIGGDPPTGEPQAGTDIGALSHGFVSVTPLNMDMTDRAQMEEIACWGLRLPE
jgi:5'-nucleotidase